MTSKLFTLFSVLFLVACDTNKQIEAKARIFERKMLENGKLMICYSFSNNNTIIRDSMVIDNLVIPQDSVAIVFKKNYPENSNLLLTPGNH